MPKMRRNHLCRNLLPSMWKPCLSSANERARNPKPTDRFCSAGITSRRQLRREGEEAQTLPYECIKEIISNSQKHFLIIGRTTKLNHGRAKATQWITSVEGLKAVRIAQKIADHIYQIHDDEAVQVDSDIFQYPLFISASYFGFTGKTIEPTTTKYRIGTLYSKQGINKLIPKIEQADLEELEQIV